MADLKKGDRVESMVRGTVTWVSRDGFTFDLELDNGRVRFGLPVDEAVVIEPLLTVGAEVVISERDRDLDFGSVVGDLVKLSDGRWHDSRYNASFDPTGLTYPRKVKYLP